MRSTDSRAKRATSRRVAGSPGGSAHPAPAPPPSNERFRRLFERASVGIISVGAEGRAVEANPAVERMLGYSAGELIGMSFTAFTHPEDVGRSKREYRQLRDEEQASYQYEKRYVRKDGEVIWCRVTVWKDAGRDDSGRVAIAMIEDITESRLTATALQEKAERLERVIATQRDVAEPEVAQEQLLAEGRQLPLRLARGLGYLTGLSL